MNKIYLNAREATRDISEAEELVEPGTPDPDEVLVAGIYVHLIFQGSHYEKKVEGITKGVALK